MNNLRILKNVVLTTLISTMLLGTINVYATPNNLDDANKQRDDLLEEIQVTDKEIETMIAKMDNIQNQLELKENEIDESLMNITETKSVLKEKQNLLEDRVKNINTTRIPIELQYVDIIFSSDNLTDFFDKANFISKSIEYDRKLITEVKTKQKYLKENEKRIEKDKKYLEDGKYQLEMQQAELDKKKELENEKLRVLNSYISIINNPFDTATISKEDLGLEDNDITDYASTFLGIPYVWGGTTPSGFDCSGFVQYVYAAKGVNLPRVSEDQQKVGRTVTASEAKPGDLIFYGNPAHHVTMYVGNGYMIHAPHTGDIIRYAPVDFNTVTNIKRIVE